MKKLFLDIETSPHQVYCWGLWSENIGVNQIIQPSRVLCVAYAFDNEKMQFVSEWQDGRKKMIEVLHTVLDKADAVVHYNGVSFDETHLNREFLQAGLNPPSKYQSIDLYRTVKRRFRFAANKLEQVAKELELREGKIKTDFELWRGVLAGYGASLLLMEQYNREDVELTRVLYKELLPWIDRHPNAALYENDTLMRCTRCASENMTKDGFARTSAGTFQKYRCGECGGQSRGMKRDATTPLREA